MNDNIEYQIINYWNNEDDLYVNYFVKDKINKLQANAVEYFNTSDIGCDYNISSHDTIINNLYLLISKNNGKEFSLPKISEVSNLLKYIYDCVCNNDSNMCHIDYDNWNELLEESEFNESDLDKLLKEIKEYNLYDYITLDDGEYKICGYGGLQCCFNDDRLLRKEEENER